MMAILKGGYVNPHCFTQNREPPKWGVSFRYPFGILFKTIKKWSLEKTDTRYAASAIALVGTNQVSDDAKNEALFLP